jgi:hypothetical protein
VRNPTTMAADFDGPPAILFYAHSLPFGVAFASVASLGLIAFAASGPVGIGSLEQLCVGASDWLRHSFAKRANRRGSAATTW